MNCLTQRLFLSWLVFFFVGGVPITIVTFSLVAYTGCTNISYPVYFSDAFRMQALRDCVFHAPTLWGVTIDHRFQGLSYYFSVTETPEYNEKIKFMETYINKSLDKYKSGITLEQVINAQSDSMTRIQIINQKLYVVKPKPLILGRGIAHTISLLLDILKIYKGRVPDIDFILNTDDDPPSENLKLAPIFTFNKYKNENIIAIPFIVNKMEDIYALNTNQHFIKSYNFSNKKSKAVWRGQEGRGIRDQIYQWTRSHKDIIDYEFSIAHTGYKSTNFLSWTEQEHFYKYLLDVDGLGWSSRFIQLLNMDVVIIKQESLHTDFCNEMIPETMYLTFNNETTMVQSIQSLIQKGDEYALNMIQERRTFAKRYCSKDAQTMYLFTVLNLYANLQQFKVTPDKNAIHVYDEPSISYLEFILISFVVASAAISALCCAQNFLKCKDYFTLLMTEHRYETIPEEAELEELV